MAYIDREKFYKSMLKRFGCVPSLTDHSSTLRNDIHLNEALDMIPTADVTEVKHGYWKDRYDNKYDNHLYECSVCEGRALYKIEADELGHEIVRQDLSPYCPHCGAKMDGRSDT